MLRIDKILELLRDLDEALLLAREDAWGASYDGNTSFYEGKAIGLERARNELALTIKFIEGGDWL